MPVSVLITAALRYLAFALPDEYVDHKLCTMYTALQRGGIPLTGIGAPTLSPNSSLAISSGLELHFNPTPGPHCESIFLCTSRSLGWADQSVSRILWANGVYGSSELIRIVEGFRLFLSGILRYHIEFVQA